jgi:hypothetical protein
MIDHKGQGVRIAGDRRRPGPGNESSYQEVTYGTAQREHQR